MASTRPYWAINLPSGPSWHEQWWDFNSDLELGDFAIDVIGGVGAEQCGWKGSVVISDGRLGELLITNDSQDNASTIVQAIKENIRFNSLGKTTYLIARLKVSDDDQIDWMFGAWKRDTVPLGGTDGASDGIWFRKDDGDDNLDAVRAYNAATFPDDYSQENDIYTVVADTYMILTIRVVMDANTAAIGTVNFYVDNVIKYTTTAGSSIVPDEELAIGVGVMNGEAVAKTMTIDGMGILQER